jgi:hypothetical protein
MSLPPPFSNTGTRETHHDIEVQTKETATRILSQTKNDVFLDSETKLHHVITLTHGE